MRVSRHATMHVSYLSKHGLCWLGDDCKAAELVADLLDRLFLFRFDRKEVFGQEDVAHAKCVAQLKAGTQEQCVRKGWCWSVVCMFTTLLLCARLLSATRLFLLVPRSVPPI